jgi:hypothetical protein
VNDTGKPLPYAPVWTANASVQYAFHLFGNATLTPRLSYGMTGPQKTTLTQLRGDRIGAHNLINGQLEFDSDPWSVTLYATNLADLIRRHWRIQARRDSSAFDSFAFLIECGSAVGDRAVGSSQKMAAPNRHQLRMARARKSGEVVVD